MGEGFYFVDIIIFALIAGFLVYRLRSVLGKRHGEERTRPNPFGAPPGPIEAPDNVVALPDRGRPPELAIDPDEPMSLAAGLAAIKGADPGFDEKHFAQGARHAFEMIVEAFAKGDTATLRPLLSDDVYDGFAAAIRRRVAEGESHETRLDRFKDVDFLEARLDGRTATVTLKFVTDQMNVTRDQAGAVLEGDPERSVEVVDIWTFARNTRARDPNWLLVETRTPN